MRYSYGGTETVAAEAERLDTVKQQARRELKERRLLLEKLRRDRREIEAIEADRHHLETEIRHLSAVATQPEPRYGGEAGLIAAAAESARYDRARRAA